MANIIATNIKPSEQFKVCKAISQIYNFRLIENISKLDNIDLIFASEYFEHFREPVKHLKQILNKLSPKYLLIANAFSTRSLGHFDYYLDDNIKYSGKEISKVFNNTLKEMDYLQVKTTCWNNRPSYFIKK